MLVLPGIYRQQKHKKITLIPYFPCVCVYAYIRMTV